ncbi:tRNA (adenosine(37)-N6)-threonylcarbamoyltransferase complex dimerization subunit type 1 TsaB [Actibacterium sp. D379-3]
MPPDPLILGFDTSAAHCAAALLSGDRVLACRAEEMGKGQAERLMPLLQDLLAEGGATWRDLAVLGVGVGPGNFTGIRIAVSAARGLALSLGVPAVGVSTFEAQAFGLPRPVTALVDARRGMVYVQHFDETGGTAPQLLPCDQAMGDSRAAGIPVAGALLPGALAVNIAHLAARRLAAGTDIPRPAPLYIRAADAAPASDPPPVILP